jgi:hypothetical protein
MSPKLSKQTHKINQQINQDLQVNWQRIQNNHLKGTQWDLRKHRFIAKWNHENKVRI